MLLTDGFRGTDNCTNLVHRYISFMIGWVILRDSHGLVWVKPPEGWLFIYHERKPLILILRI